MQLCFPVQHFKRGIECEFVAAVVASGAGLKWSTHRSGRTCSTDTRCRQQLL